MHKKQLGISTTEMKWKMFFNTFPEFNTKEKFQELYEKNSIPDFERKFNCYQIYNVIDYYELPHRSVSEVRQRITQKKFEETCMKKYGCTNPSKSEIVKNKKRDTFKKHFGVDNIFKDPDFIDYVKSGEWCSKRYGCTQSELKSKNQKARIAAMSDIEKESFLQNSLWKNKFNANNSKIDGICGSSLEVKVAKLFAEGCMDFETQFKLNYKRDSKRAGWKFYDFFLKDLNVLVEVNGDYWHANPKKYKLLDEIEYSTGKVLVKNVWEKNVFKEKIAQEKAYIMVCIWEDELKDINTFTELNALLRQKLKEVQEYGTTYKQEKDKLQQQKV